MSNHVLRVTEFVWASVGIYFQLTKGVLKEHLRPGYNKNITKGHLHFQYTLFYTGNRKFTSIRLGMFRVYYGFGEWKIGSLTRLSYIAYCLNSSLSWEVARSIYSK